MTDLSVLLFAYGGLAFMGLAMRRQRGVTGPDIGPVKSAAFRIAGVCLLSAALFVALRHGGDVGLVEWIGGAGLCGVTFIIVRALWTNLAFASAAVATALGGAALLIG